MEEDEKKREILAESDSTAKDDAQPGVEKQKRPEKTDPETPNSAPEDDLEKEAGTVPSSSTVISDESPDPPETPAENELNEINELNNIGSENKDDKEPSETSLDEEVSPKPVKRIFSVKLIISSLLIVAAFSGFFVFDSKSKPKAVKNEKTSISDNRRVLLPKNQQDKQLTHQSESARALDAKIGEISTLRDTLLHKQAEILELKADYQKGIDELEKEIADEMQKEEISSFLQALEHKRIEFGLQTIQRREIYIQKLERPLNWILEASEELLYLKRQALVDLQVAEISSGIDLDMHIKAMDAASEKYKLTAAKLAIDPAEAQAEPLETIWERINHKRFKFTAAPFHSKNQVITEQICRGNFERLTELTEISAEAAKCITQMQGSGLFLKDLNELTPAAARYLFQWNGNWICLNGLRVLSPRVARYLFQWEGNWISLNGLTEFPAEIGEALLQWNGAQLELMGLRYIDGSPGKISVECLAQWERFGGKLFVPDNVRKKIDAFNRKPA